MTTVAPHIRGRIFVLGRQTKARGVAPYLLWGMEVVNYATGKIIASDNCTNLATLYSECRCATEAARIGWFYGYRKQDLKS